MERPNTEIEYPADEAHRKAARILVAKDKLKQYTDELQKTVNERVAIETKIGETDETKKLINQEAGLVWKIQELKEFIDTDKG